MKNNIKISVVIPVWNGVKTLEADPTYFEKLVAEYKEVPTAHPINKFVSFEGDSSLDTLFLHDVIHQPQLNDQCPVFLHFYSGNFVLPVLCFRE
jgi:hypothetical protein